MDYEAMTTPQLQAECKRRGLPSGRVKAELVERLRAADGGAEMTVEPEPERVVHEVFPQPERTGPEPTVPNPPPLDTPQPATVVPANVFRRTFPAGPEGPNDDQHASYRAQTIRAAVEAGLTPRGDAHRIGTIDRREVYEVYVRQEPRS